jgi:pimeloyl-ACP methyl ester carboxylesterase
MKRYLPLFLFLPIAIFLFANTWAQGLPEIIINDADATTTIELFAPPMDFFDASEASFRLPNEAAVCRADQRLTIDLVAPANDFFDAGEANFRLPNEAAVCRADERLTIDLVAPPEEFFNPAPDVKILSKTPAIFVPGLLGTEISDGRDLLWLDVERIVSLANDDSFLDVLSFDGNLLPISELKLSDVIKEKNYSLFNTINFHYDYSRGLIDEFTAQGYDADEGSDDQTFYTFPYDWRYGASGIYPKPEDASQMDVTNSVLLGQKIGELAKISPTGKVDVIAHSLGGLVAKKYVLENDNPKIGKLVFLGVPNLGAPLAGRALIAGTDFGVFGLNPQELKKISQNMPAAYDLLPAKNYFPAKGSWVRIVKETNLWGINESQNLDWTQTQIYLAGADANNTALDNAIDLHSDEFDGDNIYEIMANKGTDSYNIAGCRSATFSALLDMQSKTGVHQYYDYFEFANGDDTVPFESANRKLAKDENTFYVRDAKHGQMPSAAGIRQKIAGIVSQNNIPLPNNKIITHAQLRENERLCRLFGIALRIDSPLAIKVTDRDGNIIENIPGVGPKNEIPGAMFEINESKKFVYLPQNEDQQYQISLQGEGDGFFTLTARAVKDDLLQEPRVFSLLPVSKNLSGGIELSDQGTIIKIDNDGDGKIDQTISQDEVFTINELMADFNRYAAAGLIKKPQRTVILARLKLLQKEFAVLEKLQANNRLPQKVKTAAISASRRLINRQIDLLAKEIQTIAKRKTVGEETAQALLSGLARVKPK